jgi:hypothetical protein
VGPFKILGVFVSSGWCGNLLKSNCAGFQIICNMPGIWGRLWMAMRRQAEAQAEGGHVEHLL